MNTSTKSTRISAVFLSAVLIAGTIAALFPSFMIGAQADPYYGMDKDNKKVDKKQVSVSSLKCNNINVNVNGLTLDVFPPFLGGGDIAAEAVEPSTDASSFAGSGGNDKSEFNDFRFICINNNNNTVVAAEEPVPPVPPIVPENCDDCFLPTTEDGIIPPTLLTQLNNYLANNQITFGESTGIVGDVEGLCEVIVANEGILEVQIETILNAAIPGNPDVIEAIIECLEEVGLIFEDIGG